MGLQCNDLSAYPFNTEGLDALNKNGFFVLFSCSAVAIPQSPFCTGLVEPHKQTEWHITGPMNEVVQNLGGAPQGRCTIAEV